MPSTLRGQVVTEASNPRATSHGRRPGRPADHFEARKTTIIGAAAHLFAEKGFHGTSIADICKATGMGKGVIYYYISTKEQILIEIHERFIDSLLEAGTRIVARDEPPDVRLRDFGLLFLRVVAQSTDEVTVFLHEWKAIKGESQQWADAREKRSRYAAMQTDLLREGMEQGLFRPDLDLHITTLALIGMHNYTYQWYRAGGRLSADQIAAQYHNLLLRGLCAAPEV